MRRRPHLSHVGLYGTGVDVATGRTSLEEEGGAWHPPHHCAGGRTVCGLNQADAAADLVDEGLCQIPHLNGEVHRPATPCHGEEDSEGDTREHGINVSEVAV